MFVVRPAGLWWRCLEWPARLMVWVTVVAVLIIEVRVGLDLPTAIAIALAAGFVSDGTVRWVLPGVPEFPPRRPRSRG